MEILSQITNFLIIFVNSLNNREKAIAIWLSIFFAFALTKEGVRNSFLGVLKAMFLTKLSLTFLGTIGFVVLITSVLSKYNFWDISLLKDSIYWTVVTGFILLATSNKALGDKNFFRDRLLDTFKLTIILEFIINLYSFDLWIELIFIPLIILFTMMQALADVKNEFKPARKPLNWMLGLFGLIMFVYALYQTIIGFKDIFTFHNLETILLPIILTVAYIPLLYLFVVYMAYELLFVRLDRFLRNNQSVARYAKQQVLRLCLLNINKLNYFVEVNNSNFWKLNSKSDVSKMVNEFKEKYQI